MKVITERHASAILEKRKQVDGYSLIVEGDSSTDDESDSETSAYEEARDSLLQRAEKNL